MPPTTSCRKMVICVLAGVKRDLAKTHFKNVILTREKSPKMSRALPRSLTMPAARPVPVTAHGATEIIAIVSDAGVAGDAAHRAVNVITTLIVANDKSHRPSSDAIENTASLTASEDSHRSRQGW